MRKARILQPGIVLPETTHPVFSNREGSERGRELCVCRDETHNKLLIQRIKYLSRCIHHDQKSYFQWQVYHKWYLCRTREISLVVHREPLATGVMWSQ